MTPAAIDLRECSWHMPAGVSTPRLLQTEAENEQRWALRSGSWGVSPEYHQHHHIGHLFSPGETQAALLLCSSECLLLRMGWLFVCLVYVGRVSTMQVPQGRSFEMPDTSGKHSLVFTRVKPQQNCALAGQEDKSSLRDVENCWRCHHPWPQILLQSYTDKTSIVLA